MALLQDVSIVLVLLAGAVALYRVTTKLCWACEERLPAWRHVCSHCGRCGKG